MKLSWIFIAWIIGSTTFASGLENQGQINLFGATMPQQDNHDLTSDSGGVELKLRSQYEFNSNWRLRFAPWLQYDPLNKSPEEKNQFELDELAVEWKKSSRRVKLGYSTVNFEGTDFLNPMDIVHAKNWRDPFNSRTRSSAGIFYSDQWEKISWDLIYIPLQSKTLLPGTKSPWLPRRFSLPLENDILLLLPEQVEYQYQQDEILDHALDNNLALRLKYHGEAWDFSLAGSEGSASPPVLFPTLNLTPVQVSPRQIYQLQNPIQVQAVYYRQRTAAMALSFSAGSWILRASAQHMQALGEDSRPTPWSDFGVLGLEKTFEFFDQSVTWLVQYANTHKPQNGNISVVSSLLERAVMTGWRFPMGEKFVWTAAFFQELKFKSIYYHTDFTYAMTDHWSAALTADVMGGSSESVLGIYDHNDRFGLRGIYSF